MYRPTLPADRAEDGWRACEERERSSDELVLVELVTALRDVVIVIVQCPSCLARAGVSGSKRFLLATSPSFLSFAERLRRDGLRLALVDRN